MPTNHGWNHRPRPISLTWGGMDPYTKENIDHINLIINNTDEIYYITKCKDEWYAIFYRKRKGVQRDIRFYKCDQLDGLKMFINDKIVNS